MNISMKNNASLNCFLSKYAFEINFKNEINDETSTIKYNNHDITLKENKIEISNI